jgi:hypothetical protein
MVRTWECTPERPSWKCVVDTIVVEGRDQIRRWYFVPRVLTRFLLAEAERTP